MKYRPLPLALCLVVVTLLTTVDTSHSQTVAVYANQTTEGEATDDIAARYLRTSLEDLDYTVLSEAEVDSSYIGYEVTVNAFEIKDGHYDYTAIIDLTFVTEGDRVRTRPEFVCVQNNYDELHDASQDCAESISSAIAEYSEYLKSILDTTSVRNN